MGLFSKNKIDIHQLVFELNSEREENARLRLENSILNDKLDAMTRLTNATPTDCTPGNWCQACEFSRSFHYGKYYHDGTREYVVGYICGKGESCKYFVQRAEEETNG